MGLDGLTIKALFDPSVLTERFAELDRRADKVAMYTVRQGGRLMSRTARSVCPVGDTVEPRRKNYGTKNEMRKNRLGKNVRTGRVVARTGNHEPGMLRKSIGPRRRLTREGNAWVNGIASRGEFTHVYAQKIEAIYHFMEYAWAATDPLLPGIYDKAMDRMISAINARPTSR
jgi:hypothetical protein